VPRPRDSQRSRVYAAERAVEWSKRADEKIGDGGLGAAQAYVNRVIGSKAWHKVLGCGDHEREICRWAPVEVADGRGSRKARAGWSRISLPRWSRKRWVVLHELAHVAAQKRYGYYSIAGHGWQFCDVYLRLMRRFLGTDEAQKLQRAFREKRVRFRPKRRAAEQTPEQKAALVARLAAARAAAKLKRLAAREDT
jgi:hypothetical protein